MTGSGPPLETMQSSLTSSRSSETWWSRNIERRLDGKALPHSLNHSIRLSLGERDDRPQGRGQEVDDEVVSGRLPALPQTKASALMQRATGQRRGDDKRVFLRFRREACGRYVANAALP